MSYTFIQHSRGYGKIFYLKKRREFMNIEVRHGRCYLVERDERGEEIAKIDIT